MKPDLIITNGDSAANLMRAAGFAAEILPWRDILHEGPVPDLPPADVARTRADFLCRYTDVPAESIEADLLARDAKADDPRTYARIGLWFEPDLYDQLQLIQILERFVGRTPEIDAGYITLVEADTYLSDLTPETISDLRALERPVTRTDVAFAAAAWKAFSGGDPTALNARIDGPAPLAGVPAALRRLAQDFPHRDTGLTLTETRILQLLEQEPEPAGKVFAKVQALESAKFMGDLSFAACLDRLAFGPTPLTQGLPGPLVGNLDTHRTYFASVVSQTRAGRDVLAGRANQIGLNGIDRWIGGAHLTPARHWVWTGETLAST